MGRVVDGTTVVDVLPLADCAPDLSLLPEQDKDRHRRFIDTDAADSYLRRQSELRRRLGAELDVAPTNVQLVMTGNQKPILDLEGPPLHFNISSSGPLMVIAINRAGPVGVDIECHEIHHGLSASSLAPALHPKELAQLAGDDLDDTLQCWVFKEAWIKWTAEGMRADLKGLRLWQPGLADEFTFEEAAVRLHKIGPDTRFDSDGPMAWVGVVTAAEGFPDRGL